MNLVRRRPLHQPAIDEGWTGWKGGEAETCWLSGLSPLEMRHYKSHRTVIAMRIRVHEEVEVTM